MKIQIKLRWSDKVLFEGEYESLKRAVIEAVKSRANLSGANLFGADLFGANLFGANLSGEKITIAPIQIGGLRWGILITPLYLRIGCERHTHEEWGSFNRNKISTMDKGAWDWWKIHKPLLMAACELHRKEATAKAECEAA